MKTEELLTVVSRDLHKQLAWRDELVVQLRNEGATLRHLATLTGLSAPGIAKLLKRCGGDMLDKETTKD